MVLNVYVKNIDKYIKSKLNHFIQTSFLLKELIIVQNFERVYSAYLIGNIH